MAARPKTWGVAAAPVITGLAIALSETHCFDLLTAVLTAVLAILMQIITNMENDAGYTKRKAERSDRKGLPRATSLGLLSIQEVEQAIKVIAFIALLLTLYFIYIGSWFFLLITICSVIAAYLYMGGPKPIAYTPLGEGIVVLFFGLTAVGGTYYLQTLSLSWTVLSLGFALGLIAAAVLCVNNYRDCEHDAGVGRHTLAVVLGKNKTALAYQWMLFLPYVILLIIVALDPQRWPYLAAFFSFPKAIKLPKELKKLSGFQLNDVLFKTVKLELLFAFTLSFGALAHYFIS